MSEVRKVLKMGQNVTWWQMGFKRNRTSVFVIEICCFDKLTHKMNFLSQSTNRLCNRKLHSVNLVALNYFYLFRKKNSFISFVRAMTIGWILANCHIWLKFFFFWKHSSDLRSGFRSKTKVEKSGRNPEVVCGWPLFKNSYF